ncbi:septum formation initiator family protein [Helicobacter burdigaliensis]
MDKIYQNKGGFYKMLPFLTLILLVCILALYFGNLLFGENSLSVLYKLKNKEEAIRTEVNRLMNENARLQKELFELKGLEPK